MTEHDDEFAAFAKLNAPNSPSREESILLAMRFGYHLGYAEGANEILRRFVDASLRGGAGAGT